jgi:hypothetical protein
MVKGNDRLRNCAARIPCGVQYRMIGVFRQRNVVLSLERTTADYPPTGPEPGTEDFFFSGRQYVRRRAVRSATISSDPIGTPTESVCLRFRILMQFL